MSFRRTASPSSSISSWCRPARSARVNDGGREHGQIRAFNNRTFDVTKAVPTVILRNEDYGRLSRVMADGTTVELEINVVNRTYPEGATAYNVVAEIPGSDKAQEVVMLGGHIDSWHAATGATDNAIGCAVMMEAIRILQAVGVKPRRTIRLALWSGEEQGLLGSQAYVKEHFGMVENPKPAHANFAGYFNIDSGTGRARGMSVFGPTEAARILREATKGFEDNGFFGVNATQSRRRGGTDSTSFNEAGLPGIGIQQDPIEYGSAHVAHQSRHLRADHRGRREEVGDGDRLGGVSPGDARSDAAAAAERQDAGVANDRKTWSEPSAPSRPRTIATVGLTSDGNAPGGLNGGWMHVASTATSQLARRWSRLTAADLDEVGDVEWTHEHFDRGPASRGCARSASIERDGVRGAAEISRGQRRATRSRRHGRSAWQRGQAAATESC